MADPNAPNPNPVTEAEKIGEEAARVKAAALTNKGATTPVRLLYDTWDADEKRVPAGAVVDLPLEAAKALIKDGKAERADPLPGEKTA